MRLQSFEGWKFRGRSVSYVYCEFWIMFFANVKLINSF